jgi:hypothetical protein
LSVSSIGEADKGGVGIGVVSTVELGDGGVAVRLGIDIGVEVGSAVGLGVGLGVRAGVGVGVSEGVGIGLGTDVGNGVRVGDTGPCSVSVSGFEDSVGARVEPRPSVDLGSSQLLTLSPLVNVA